MDRTELAAAGYKMGSIGPLVHGGPWVELWSNGSDVVSVPSAAWAWNCRGWERAAKPRLRWTFYLRLWRLEIAVNRRLTR